MQADALDEDLRFKRKGDSGKHLAMSRNVILLQAALLYRGESRIKKSRQQENDVAAHGGKHRCPVFRVSVHVARHHGGDGRRASWVWARRARAAVEQKLHRVGT